MPGAGAEGWWSLGLVFLPIPPPSTYWPLSGNEDRAWRLEAAPLVLLSTRVARQRGDLLTSSPRDFKASQAFQAHR